MRRRTLPRHCSSKRESGIGNRESGIGNRESGAVGIQAKLLII
ncbi:hypothetical protein [Moorena sp. SIO4E2]|nr:hypothetical protein [Moorena sp. SIO4E2]